MTLRVLILSGTVLNYYILQDLTVPEIDIHFYPEPFARN